MSDTDQGAGLAAGENDTTGVPADQLPHDAPLQDWQIARFGDSVETRLALAYYRERGWRVDDLYESRQMCDRIYAFQSGYRAAVRAESSPAWRPIATAPKDGALLLLCDLNADFGIPRRYVGRWHTHCVRGEDWSRWEDMEKHCTVPTHWMPLPDPPQVGSANAASEAERAVSTRRDPL